MTPIVSKPATTEYRTNWDRIFKNKKEEKKEDKLNETKLESEETITLKD